MRAIPLLIPVLFAIFMLQSLGRTVYVDSYEFEAAKVEWHSAKDRGDRPAMVAAFRKEQLAHCRTFDPFWFSSWANDCSRYQERP